MRTHATMSGSELLLSVIAIRLTVLVAAGWGLTLLPRQARNAELACPPSAAATGAAQVPMKIVRPRVVDATLDDMLRHD